MRGLGRDQRHWCGYGRRLRQQFPQDSITCMDLPGSGDLNHLESPASIPEIVDTLRRQYAAVLRNEPLFVIAVSLGGMVAADWMRRYPDEIQAAVLTNTSGRLCPFHHRLHPRAAGNFLLAAARGILFFCYTSRNNIVGRPPTNGAKILVYSSQWP